MNTSFLLNFRILEQGSTRRCSALPSESIETYFNGCTQPAAPAKRLFGFRNRNSLPVQYYGRHIPFPLCPLGRSESGASPTLLDPFGNNLRVNGRRSKNIYDRRSRTAKTALQNLRGLPSGEDEIGSHVRN